MTWLSRLLPQSPRLPRLADHNYNNRSRQALRRRSMATLESLEARTLLNGTVNVSPAAAGVVTIKGDGHNNAFTITELGSNQILVSGQNSTSINGLNIGVSVKVFQVTSIIVNLPGASTGAASLDTVSITQTAGVRTGIGTVSIYANTGTTPAGLNLSVTSVTNTGALTVTSTGYLNASVTGSQFPSLSISQTGCCLATVELDGDTVLGTVTVSEGLENYDYIGLNTTGTALDKFGATTLTQGAGTETTAGNLGDFDQVVVNDANLLNLAITQPTGTATIADKYGKYDENGDQNSIIVGLGSDVQVALLGFGITATQGDGEGDFIEIISISTTLPTPATNLSFVLNQIEAGTITSADGIHTTQGNGGPATKAGTLGDQTLIENARVYGNIVASQGIGNYDDVEFQSDTAGIIVTPVGLPLNLDVFGDGVINQGNGYHDTATVDCNGSETVPPTTNPATGPSSVSQFNNIYIHQGDSTPPPPGTPCVPGLGDVASVNCTTVTSDLVIAQGVNGTSVGNNVVNIGTTEPVSVGGFTDIDEDGPSSGNNAINLGGATGPDSGAVIPDFYTLTLDVNTGAGGGAVVTVENTLLGLPGISHEGNPFNVNGDGSTGNTINIDNFSYAYVTFDGSFVVGYP